jgi:hypothetical protein
MLTPRQRLLCWLALAVCGLGVAVSVVPKRGGRDAIQAARESPAQLRSSSEERGSSLGDRPSSNSPLAEVAEGATMSRIHDVATLRALSLPDALRRPGVESVAAALEELNRLEESARAAYLQSLLQFCLAKDPAASADLAATMPSAELRDLGVNFVLLQWAAQEPAAALRWAGEHPKESNDASRFYAAYEGFAGTQPMQALQMLREPALNGDWDALARITLFHCEQTGQLTAARAWVEALPEGNLRDVLVQQVVRTWAAKSPDDAAVWLASVASDATFRAGMGELLQATAQTRPELAAALSQKFSEPEIRTERLADLIYVWAKRDLAAAATWIRAQPPGPNLDAAIVRLAEATAPFDRNEASGWVNSIRDAGLRNEVKNRLKL